MHQDAEADLSRVLAGGGDMGALMRGIDWARTPVGSVADWPQSLRTVLSILLASRHPIFVWWGPELIQFYNDAYRPILGATKHPAALGQPGRDCWREIWDVIAPMIAAVMERGEATFLEDSLLVLDRNGYLEECYFVYAYTPIRDEAGDVGGIFVACTETTSKVLGARRLRTLRDLADRAVGVTSDQAVCQRALEVLGNNRADLPFAALYLRDADEPQARLIATMGVPASATGFPCVLVVKDGSSAASAPIAQAAHKGIEVLISDVVMRFGALSGGPWPEHPQAALALPLHDTSHTQPFGVLVVGLSPRLPNDADYRSFLGLIADQIGTGVASARAVEAERRRAESLAELDRAKTAFFSNVSHEFRTPLTLLLGPVEQALAHTVDAEQRQRLELIQRNALRLQKLVTMQLDFSRIEAGRFQAVYTPTDLAACTSALASLFHSAVEQAGLQLQIDCPPLPEPIYVDREMYEKIVLNLVSNAFKYTLAGEIAVVLEDAGDAVLLRVRDTGTGIAPEHLPRIFERFHRVEGAWARTHEGTGIGLSLVQELARLHGGSIEAQSSLGQGSTFTVRLPKGSNHLPASQIGAAPNTSNLAAHHIRDGLYGWYEPLQPAAERCLSAEAQQGGSAAPLHDATLSDRPRIVWADDNLDMREYVRGLLAERYTVVAVANGQAALEAVRSQMPDLVLSDVMMPELDGFGLVRALRADPQTQTIPIILLSARAGEEAQLVGLETGIDDYLIKPFSARELLARVQTHLQLGRLRREAEAALRESHNELERRVQQRTAELQHSTVRLAAELESRHQAEATLQESEARQRLLLQAIPDALLRVGRDGTYRDAVEAQTFPLVRRPAQLIGTTILDVLPPDLAAAKLAMIAAALATTTPQQLDYQWEMEGQLHDLEDRIIPSAPDEVLILVRDVSARKRAERQLEAALREKEVLLKEVHHRVKNNLQVIASLLRLQAATLTDPAVRELFRDSQHRVRAMALIHEQLYNSPDLGQVPFADYLRALVDTLLRLYLVQAQQIQLAYNLDTTVLLPIDAAVPLGLIIAELLSNCVKHAFPEQRVGTVTIMMYQQADMLTITLRDDGVGLPAGLDLAQAQSLGLQIVTNLVEQLHATICLSGHPGTHIVIAIPITAREHAYD